MVSPPSNLPRESQPWGKDIDSRLKTVEERTSTLGNNLSATSRKADASQTNSESATQNAEQAQNTAGQAQEEATTAKAAALRLPGDNLFDVRAITDQNITFWNVERIYGYSWLTNGIRVEVPQTATDGSGEEVAVWNNVELPFASRITGSTLTISYASNISAGSQSTNRAPMVLEWRDINGAIITGYQTSFSGVPFPNASSTYTNSWTDIAIPPDAATLRIGFRAYRQSGATSSITMDIVSPYVALQLPGQALARTLSLKLLDNASLTGFTRMTGSTLAQGSTSTIEMRSVADETNYDPKITYYDKAGSLLWTLEKLPKFNVIQSERLLSSRGEEILPGYFQVDNLRSNNATTYTQSVPNATWMAMNVPTAALASHVVTYNTMGVGVSGTAVYVYRDGLYEFDINAVFGNATGGTARSIAFSVNGSSSYVWESANRQPAYVNAVLVQRAFAKLALKTNDYVQVMFRQDSGATLPICRIENYGIKFIGSA